MIAAIRAENTHGRRRRPYLRANLTFGASLAGLVLILTAIGLFWTPQDSDAISIATRLSGPGENGHLLGSDWFGRDMLSQLMVGGRSAIFLATLSAMGALFFGTLVGGWAAVRGGGVEEVTMRAVDVIYAFPAVILAIVVAASLGPGVFSAITAIIVIFTPQTARIVRGAMLSLIGRDWFVAARGYGRSRMYIFFRQCIPNMSAVLIVEGTLLFAYAVLVEAALSYLGLGVQPPAPSWGRMLRDAQEFLTLQPWLAVFPGLAIFITVLGVNLIGDGLRDVLDPHSR